MNAELKTHKDLDAWKDLELWTHDSRLSTLDWFFVTHYASLITVVGSFVRNWNVHWKGKRNCYNGIIA